MGNTAKIREILAKMPRWPSRIPRGDVLREIERKLSYFGEGYSDHDLELLSSAVDIEVKRMFSRQNERKAQRDQAKKEQAERERGNVRRFGSY